MPVVVLAPFVAAPGPFAPLVFAPGLLAPGMFLPIGIAPPALRLGLGGGRCQPQGNDANRTEQHCNSTHFILHSRRRRSATCITVRDRCVFHSSMLRSAIRFAASFRRPRPSTM